MTIRRHTTPALIAAAGLAVAVLGSRVAPATAAAQPADTTGDEILLADNTPLKRAAPPEGGAPGHLYKYRTTTPYWSVVAADPTSTVDTDLDVFGQRYAGEFLEDSTLAAGLTDFVAVDSNHQAYRAFHPAVRNFGGSGKYVIELAQGSAILGSTPESVSMPGSALVSVRDTQLTAGVTYRFELAPGTSTMRGSLFLMQSDPAVPDTYIQPRINSVASGVGVAGETTVVYLTPGVTDWYGVVLLSEGTGGVFQLQRTVV